MADAEQWLPEVEEHADTGLKAIGTNDALSLNGNEAVVHPREVANGHGLDTNEDTDVADILAFDDIGANVDGTTNASESAASQVETGESSKSGEVLEEEIVELEFEKVKPKLATHTMHCPNCKSEITKVTLRRKIISYRPPDKPAKPVVPEPEPEPEPEQKRDEGPLVGCLSCLSLFTCSDNGCFRPFDIFRKRLPDAATDVATPLQPEEKDNNESCFSMFWVIRKEHGNQKLEDPQQSGQVVSSQEKPTANLKGKSILGLGTSTEVPVPSNIAPEIADTSIDIVNEPVVSRGRPWLGYEGVLAEILKSIVYGGLLEVIASLSVVASAAASDAATLNIISLALASLIGGVFVIGHNLWDLRDDCYKGDSSQETNKEATNKYKELLGQVNYFPLHAIFAILSYLLFGMVPPVAYGFSIHETNDKDFTVVVVAIASLLCVSVLAIFKAYINKCTVIEYFKTVVYYITTAVLVSGVSYVAGNLITRLMEEYGLFETSSSGVMSLLSHVTTQSIASF